MNITDYIVTKLNGYGNVKFKSNYVFDFRQNQTGLQFTVFNISGTQLDFTELEFVPVSEVVNQNTPYVENNKRDGYVKTFAFPIRIKDGLTFKEDDSHYQALITLRDELNGSVDTVNGQKTSFKVTYPRYDKRFLNGGEWYGIFVLDFYLTTVQEGYFCNESTISIRKDGETTYHELDFIEFSQPTGADTITVGDVSDNNRTKDIVSRYSTSFTLSFNYFGGTLEDELYQAQMGQVSPTQIYNLKL